jgi:6-phosphogluconolactonase
VTSQVRRSADPDALADAVAAALIERLAEVQAEGRIPSVLLTAGGIAERIHRAVSTSIDGLDVDWSKVDFYFGDERYVDSWSEDRNALAARRDLLDRVGVDPARVHEMPARDSRLTLEEAAETYADTVRTKGTGEFDVVMLGVGPDGHVASLFPGHPALDVDDRIAVAVTGAPKPPPERISLTFPALNRTRAVWFVVSGEGKAEAVARARRPGAERYDVPAAGVSGGEETIWWLDEGAVSAL